MAIALLAAALGVWLIGRTRDEKRSPAQTASKTTTTPGKANATRMAAAAEVVVLVRSQRGGPIVGAHVVARAEHREPVVERTDATGSARLAGLANDEWRITASASGHLASERKVLVATGARETVELQLVAGGAVLRGTITDGRGPVAGARVDAARVTRGITFADKVTASATSDEQGRYELVVAVAGYHVEASHPAYAPVGRRIEVPASGAVGDFTLLPGGAIEGRVVDGEERPVAGAVVVASGGSNESHTVLADAEGRFRIAGLRPASIEVDASAPGWIADDPVDVRLAVGEEVSDIVLRMHRVPLVSGVVVDGKGAPVPSVRVDLLGPRYRTIERVTTAADGTFVFDAVSPGAYQIISAAPRWRAGATAIEVKEVDVTGVRVVRSESPVVRGRVEPPQSAEVWLQPVRDGPPVSFDVPTPTNADGTFELTPGDVGKMRVAARTLTGLQGTSDIEVTAAGLEVVVPLRGGGVIAGRVVDGAGAPVQSVAVMALPLGSSRVTTIVRGGVSDGRQAPTGTDGTFKLEGLQAAQYEVRVLDQGRALVGPDGKPVSVEVVLADAESRNLTLTVTTANGVVKGVVRASDGKPVADAWVRAVQHPWELFKELKAGAIAARDRGGQNAEGFSFDDRDGDQVSMTSPALTGADGTFELRGLRPGIEVKLIAEAERGTLRGRTKAKPNAEVTITVAATAALTGTVTLGGAPVTTFEIELSGPSRITRTFTSATGQFALPRVEAGTYGIEVTSPQGSAEKADVKIETGATANVELALVAFGKVTGTLVDERQQPVAGVELNPNLILSDNASTIGLRGPVPISGPDGRFEAIVTPGKIRLHVDAKGRHAPSPEVAVAPGATVDAGRIVITDKPAKE